jgi:hypothetical protein
MKRIILAGAVLFAATMLVTSCKKDSNNPASPIPTASRKVKFKAFASSNAKVSIVVHTNDQGDSQTHSNVNAQTWESPEMTIPGSVPAVVIGANGQTNDLNENGTLTVQIIIDGKVVKENVSNGNVLSATATSY